MTVAAVAQIVANRYRLREALGSGGMFGKGWMEDNYSQAVDGYSAE